MTEEEVRIIAKEEIRIAFRDLLPEIVPEIVSTFADRRAIISRDGQACYGYAPRYSTPQEVFEKLLEEGK